MLFVRLIVPLTIAALLSACSESAPPPTSTLIANAAIIDGTGSEPFTGAVRIDADRILDVGDLEALDGETVIDAGGLVLAPGFIDTHSHHDSGMEEYLDMPGVLSQGITTIVRGNDGFGDSSPDGYASIADFNAAFAENPAAVNVASYSPHNTIRYYVMGDDNRRHATAVELEAMAALVTADMEAGALGLATGLEYEPGISSSIDEVIALATVAAAHDGRYISHVRDEDDKFMDAVDELIEIGRATGMPIQVSHIKLADREYWGTTADVIAKLDAARAEGIEVSADIYPYERWASNLAVLFPARDYSDRDVATFTFEHTATPDDIVLSYYAPNPEFEGMSIAEIAGITERSVEDTLLELSKAADDYRRETGQGGAGIIARGMDEGDVAGFMLWEYTNICSDGGHGGGHPRGYGAFPRVLSRFVRELGVLDLHTAIYKMTGLSADNMGFADRGRIVAGNVADLVLFDPDTIQDHATMQDSEAVSTGIDKVWVNGTLAWENGSTVSRPGRIVGRTAQ